MDFNEISFRARYNETDQMGVIYHGNYAQYLEMGRVEWLRSKGISYREMEEKGIILPVISLQTKFIKSAFYDDLLIVRTTLKKKPSVRIEFDFIVFNEKREVLAKATVELVFMDKEKRRPIKCPEYILEKLDLE